MFHAEGDRRINEGGRGGCGERMATILERNSNSSSNSSRVDTKSVSSDTSNIYNIANIIC